MTLTPWNLNTFINAVINEISLKDYLKKCLLLHPQVYFLCFCSFWKEDGRAADVLWGWDAFTHFVGVDIIETVFGQFEILNQR